MSYLPIKTNQQSGFSLLEVLISLLVLGIGLLGLGGLQVASLKGTTNAHSRTIATMFAMDLADRMRANPLGVKGGFYGTSVSCSGGEYCRNSTYCTPQQIAVFDLQEVMCGTKRTSFAERENGIKNTLLNGTLEISCNVDCSAKKAIHNITITWGETKTHPKIASDNLIQTQSLVVPVIP